MGKYINQLATLPGCYPTHDVNRFIPLHQCCSRGDRVQPSSYADVLVRVRALNSKRLLIRPLFAGSTCVAEGGGGAILCHWQGKDSTGILRVQHFRKGVPGHCCAGQ